MGRKKTPKVTAASSAQKRAHASTATEVTSSPRKSQRVSANLVPQMPNSEKAPKVPSRCGKGCEGQPLRSQCIHTKAGRAFLIAQEAQKNMEDIPNNPFVAYSTQAPQEGPPPVHTPRPSTAGTSSDNCNPPPVSPVIDPFLLGMSEIPQPINMSGDATVGETPQCPSGFIGDDNPSGAASMPIPSTSTASTPTSQRIRATASRPIYKHVKGVLCGNVPHKVHRKHAKPTPIVKSTYASKVFLEKMNSLVELAEDISIKTGAWLFVGAQHPAATGGPMNYSSPQLRRDGGERTEQFATDFLKLIQKSAEAKRLDTIELQKAIDDEREERERIQNQLDIARAQAAADSQELTLFHQKYGLLECNSGSGDN